MPPNRSTDAVLDTARRWQAADPDPETARTLGALIASVVVDPDGAEAAELGRLFTGRIEFGTAGLRAALGPGPNRMNRLVVRQTTAGLMRWLRARADEPLVVIGYDARHGSHSFATDAAAMVAAMGGRAELLPGPLPTPVLAFAVLERRADAGVMITASHNPPADNGYKLYLSDGIQLIPPADAEIAAEIDRIASDGLAEPDPASSRINVLTDEVAAAHRRAAVAALRTRQRSVRTVYTAMHGVGGRHLLEAFESAGFPAPIVVAEQFDPDPDFPTVAFPNPEEPGALDRARARAREVGADVVIANDPDADRLALAIPDRDDPGRYVALSGDQVGVLLADHLIRHTDGDNRLVSSSIVSSRLIGHIAETAGVASVVTLTGFKWVARPIVDQPNRTFVLGYEEALGYCVGDRVRDKDGISAALVAAEMVADAIARGETLWDRLDRLAIRHGLHLTGPVSVRLPGADGLDRRTAIMDGLIDAPPDHLGGGRLVESIDLSTGEVLPPTAGLVLHYDDGTRVIIRPSGTEPKLKAYVEVVEPVGDPASLRAATDRGESRLGRYRSGVANLLGG